MIDTLMRALAEAGLRPVGIDLSAFGMIRALAGANGSTAGPASEQQPSGAEEAGGLEDADQQQQARLYCNLGDVVNLAVAQGSSCLFTRISPFGVEGIAQRLAERRQLTLEHARQWLVHVGLDAPLEQIEGDRELVAAARESLAEGAAKLTDELRLSLEYYAAQEGAVGVDGIVACGPGTTIPGLVPWLERGLGHAVAVVRPQALAHLGDATASRLVLPFGLALES
jgi:type IV pilus assembly protein PilM